MLTKKYPRLTLAQGASLSVIGLFLGTITWLAALVPRLPLAIKLPLLLFTWFALWFFTHDLTHHIVGSIVGVKFQYYFLGRSGITKLKLPLVSRLMKHVPVLVLKIDKASLDKISVASRKWMHASGAIASMAMPVLILPTAYTTGPVWVGVLFTIMVVGSAVFTLYFSPKSGDLYRARIAK